MDACQGRRRKYAKSLVVVSLWLVLLLLTLGRFFRLDPDGFQLVPTAPGGIRPDWELIVLVAMLLTALSEYLAVTVVVHGLGLLLERAHQNRAEKGSGGKVP